MIGEGPEYPSLVFDDFAEPSQNALRLWISRVKRGGEGQGRKG